MPYVITTKRTEHHVRSTDNREVESRRAVATLEEDPQSNVCDEVARIMLRAGVVQQSPEWARVILRLKAGDLSSVGPLPDGTVIEVEPLSRNALADALGGEHGHVWPATDDATLARQLDAFNARERAR